MRFTDLVGPEGYTHGWVYVGAAGGADHAKAIRDLAGHVDQVHKGTGAGDSLRSAASSVERGDKEGASSHLKTAYGKIASDPGFRQGVAHDSFHQDAAAHLNAIRQHMKKVSSMGSSAHSNTGPAVELARPVVLAPHKERAVNHIRRLAKDVQRTFPDMLAHQHLTDAAREIESGRMDGAQRHLHAAIASFAPLQLTRHGVHDDTGHMAAKSFMQQAHRGYLLTRDIEDIGRANEAGRAPMTDLQQRAMNSSAPNPVGRSDRAAEGPASPPPQGSKQIQASWEAVLGAIELSATPPHETAEGRRALAAKGQTAYGTSFPVPNAAYWHKALQSVGRVPPDKRATLAAFLRKRAGELGISFKGTWIDNSAVATAVQPGDVRALEFVGPKGFIHGWLHVGGSPAPPAAAPKRDMLGMPVPQKLRPNQELAAHFQSINENKQLASGIWGPGRTAAMHDADVARLSPEQKKEYVRQTIAGTGPYAALRTAQGKPPTLEPTRPRFYAGSPPYEVPGRPRFYAGSPPNPAFRTSQFSWEDISDAIELVGPKGFVHGWIHVGPGVPSDSQAAQYHGKSDIRGDTGNGVVTGRYNHQNKTIIDRHGVANKVTSIDPSAYEAGFNRGATMGGIATSHLSLKNKLGILNYEKANRTGVLGKQLKTEYMKEAGGYSVQFGSSWDDVLDVIELVGPKGWSHGWIRAAGEGMGSATAMAASGAGMPLEAAKLPRKQQAAYHTARSMGHSHSKALAIAKRIGGAIGRGLGAGEVTESITSYANPMELSAQTGRLASEPHPFGRPGGPGLWDVKGMELPPYIQNIARALLRTGRAKDLSQAIAIAKGATNRWSKGGGHVSPEVRAASTATNASWDAKRAVAHAHTADVLHAIELYNPAGNPNQARNPAGPGGGQFTTGSSGGQSKGGKQQPAKGKGKQPPAKGKGAAPQQSRAQRKAGLLAQAKQDRAKAKMLAIKIAADRAALASASGKVSTGQKGSTTSAGASTTGSGTPAAKGAAAAASPLSAASTGLSPATVKSATAAATASAHAQTTAQLKAAITAMTTQEKNLLAKAAALTTQASKL